MAETAGLIQRLTILPLSNIGFACFWVGPHPTNTEVFFVTRSDTDSAPLGSFKNSIVDALTTAYVSRQEVVIVHGDTSAVVDSVRLEPS